MKWLLILISSLVLAGCTTEPEPQHIRESFKNGRSIDVEVDKSLTRDNWECTGDCSGHNAGYNWAEKNGIADPEDCSGKSESFIEGCEAYANENRNENEGEDEE
jgi:hypothetical protein